MSLQSHSESFSCLVITLTPEPCCTCYVPWRLGVLIPKIEGCQKTIENYRNVSAAGAAVADAAGAAELPTYT